MENKKILLLLTSGLSSNVIYNALNEKFNLSRVVIESKESKLNYLKRRIKKIGISAVAGQILFKTTVVPVLKYFSKDVISDCLNQHQINYSEINREVTKVASVNSDEVIQLIQNESPDVIVINGTSIISKKVLSSVSCPVINMHAGITPMYRGVYGGYWSLVNKDGANCGVTVHLVDTGIDTGSVLYQTTIQTSASDNFVVYPIKQLIAGLPFLVKAVEDALSNNLKPVKTAGTSSIWTHPTLGQYLYHRIFKGVK